MKKIFIDVYAFIALLATFEPRLKFLIGFELAYPVIFDHEGYPL
ncbi:hypothetical protein [Pedobacter steynii]